MKSSRSRTLCTECSLKWTECSLKCTECSLKQTECSLKWTECSLKRIECSLKWTHLHHFLQCLGPPYETQLRLCSRLAHCETNSKKGFVSYAITHRWHIGGSLALARKGCPLLFRLKQNKETPPFEIGGCALRLGGVP
jgi:hypothetical protein